MNERTKLVKIAVLDDYQGVALTAADWAAVLERAEVTAFRDHLSREEEVAARLLPFDAVCVMRERTPVTRTLLERLPNLKAIVSTGRRNAAIDLEAATARGVAVMFTGYESSSTVEHTWALLLGSARHLTEERERMRTGKWQGSLGSNLHGKVLGLLGLGNVGEGVAKIGVAFGMDVIAWSQNLTEEKAAAKGARWVSKEDLFLRSDFVSVHLVLSDRTRGLVGANELAAMKPTARLINTSRGPIVEEQALLGALRDKRIAGAAIDVFDIEPLPESHPLRTLENVLATPHIGYVTEDLYRTFYQDTVTNLTTWLDRHV